MSPWNYIVTGVAVSLFAGILFGLALADGGEWGFLAVPAALVATVGSVLAGIGVVGQGVRTGLRWHDFDELDAEERMRVERDAA